MGTLMEVSVPRLLANPARLEALSRTGLLDDAPEEAFAWFTRLVRLCLHVPVSMVTLVTEDRQVFKGQQGHPEPWRSLGETPLSYSFCQYVVATDATLVVDDAAAHPIGAENLAVQDFGVAAYLGTPIRTPDGLVVGALCAVDGESRDWADHEIAMLQTIAEGVSREVGDRLRVAGGATA